MQIQAKFKLLKRYSEGFRCAAICSLWTMESAALSSISLRRRKHSVRDQRTFLHHEWKRACGNCFVQREKFPCSPLKRRCRLVNTNASPLRIYSFRTWQKLALSNCSLPSMHDCEYFVVIFSPRNFQKTQQFALMKVWYKENVRLTCYIESRITNGSTSRTSTTTELCVLLRHDVATSQTRLSAVHHGGCSVTSVVVEIVWDSKPLTEANWILASRFTKQVTTTSVGYSQSSAAVTSEAQQITQERFKFFNHSIVPSLWNLNIKEIFARQKDPHEALSIQRKRVLRKRHKKTSLKWSEKWTKFLGKDSLGQTLSTEPSLIPGGRGHCWRTWTVPLLVHHSGWSGWQALKILRSDILSRL